MVLMGARLEDPQPILHCIEPFSCLCNYH